MVFIYVLLALMNTLVGKLRQHCERIYDRKTRIYLFTKKTKPDIRINLLSTADTKKIVVAVSDKKK